MNENNKPKWGIKPRCEGFKSVSVPWFCNQKWVVNAHDQGDVSKNFCGQFRGLAPS